MIVRRDRTSPAVPAAGQGEWLDWNALGAASWPVLDQGAVHVWRLALDLSDALNTADFADELDDAERERAGRFVFGRDRSRFVAAHVLLRRVLARYVGREPRELQFEVGPHGKPALRNDDDAGSPATTRYQPSNVCFSLAHSEHIALLGIARDVQIGVDVEVHHPLPDTEQIAQANFSPREAVQLRSLRPADRLQGFFDCWTRKEAFVKALGSGLSMALDRFDVAIGPGQAPAVLRVDGSEQAALSWTLLDGNTGPGTSSAVAVRSPDVKEVVFFGLSSGPGAPPISPS